MFHLSKHQRVTPSGVLVVKALALGLVLVFFGCESEPPQKAATTTVVRKKVGNADKTAASKKAAPAKQSAAADQKKAAPGKPAAAESKKAAAGGGKPAQPAAASQKKAAAASKKTASAAPAADKKAPGSEAPPAKQGQAQEMTLALKPPVVVLDPFEPLFKKEQPEEEDEEGGKQTKTRRPVKLTPLERIDLGQLKLTAIFRTPAGNKALVEEASGKGYIIQKGTWIGVHAGKVEQVTEDAVVVEEEVRNAIGEISLTTRELKLQKPPGE